MDQDDRWFRVFSAWVDSPQHWEPREIDNLPWNVRARVVDATNRRLTNALSVRRMFVILLVLWLVQMGTAFLFERLGATWPLGGGLCLFQAAFFVVAGATVVWFNRRARRRRRTAMAQVLSEMGLRPRGCLVCRYDLTGTTSEVCPECGQALAPQPRNAD